MAKKKIKSKSKQVAKPTVNEDVRSDVIAAAYSAPTPPIIPVFMKVCRLCESKDGPFLNIFDSEQVTAKKIDELMPFSVAENDDLPHKICFRCSAKLEELYEFIQRCIKTQENLRKALGKTGPLLTKSRMTKKAWEASLSKSNMSNDDICDALIKRAMEGITRINPSVEEGSAPDSLREVSAPETKRVTRSKETPVIKKEPNVNLDENDEGNLKHGKLPVGRTDVIPPHKVTAKKTEVNPPKTNETPLSKKSVKSVAQTKKIESTQSDSDSPSERAETSVNKFSIDFEEKKEDKVEEPKKPFNIMDYISMIKVNGVGILFQCKLCNRNFLKKEVVESHNCAKNGVPKLDIPKSVSIPEPPRIPTVKYIKIDGEMKKTLTERVKLAERTENDKKKQIVESKIEEQKNVAPPPQIKPKPRIGPASKIRRNLSNTESAPIPETPNVPTEPNPPTPTVQFPAMPNLNGRFKLLPGPNNMFTLVEDHTQAPSGSVDSKQSNRKRKAEVVTPQAQHSRDKYESPEVIDLEDASQPYPVGLFQTVASRVYEQPVSETSPTFTTPAMKKQSYTVVQTGNPSKLLISTKAKDIDVEVAKKRLKKNKPEGREDSSSKEPYRVTLEDVTPPKDAAFFSFINVDPLLQPSYVLPTNNIIQESQITTSSAIDPTDSKEAKDKYSCNMCGETFSREKKLLAHIQSHYNKLDEEDQMRSELGKLSRKKGKK